MRRPGLGGAGLRGCDVGFSRADGDTNSGDTDEHATATNADGYVGPDGYATAAAD